MTNFISKVLLLLLQILIMNKKERVELFSILFIPFLFLLIMWLVKIIEHTFHFSFIQFGVYPQSLNGLKGVLFSPFIHKDFTHLLNNSYPIIILGGMLFSFYKKIAPQLFLWLFFISGFWLWIIGRPSFHIGASGIIYGLASYIFISGVIRKNISLMGLSMIVVFLYGSMIWGILPFDYLLGTHYVDLSISFEGHFWGAAAGFLLAFWYREQGPQRKKYLWQIEEEMGIEPPDFEGQLRQQEIEKTQRQEVPTRINYIITKKSNEKNKE